MNDFLGRILTVYTSHKTKQGTGVVMQGCELKEVAGRTFLVGTVVDTGGKKDYWAGTEAAIPWDQVASMFSMTPEQFEEKKQSW